VAVKYSCEKTGVELSTYFLVTASFSLLGLLPDKIKAPVIVSPLLETFKLSNSPMALDTVLPVSAEPEEGSYETLSAGIVSSSSSSTTKIS
jgi:hypothetical protein